MNETPNLSITRLCLGLFIYYNMDIQAIHPYISKMTPITIKEAQEAEAAIKKDMTKVEIYSDGMVREDLP